MADNKKELFHWNFDLKNSDSDFTDIEYSPEVIPPADIIPTASAAVRIQLNPRFISSLMYPMLPPIMPFLNV